MAHHQKMDGISHHSNRHNNQHNKIVISQTLDQYNRKAAQIGARHNQIWEQTGQNIHISNNHQHRLVRFEILRKLDYLFRVTAVLAAIKIFPGMDKAKHSLQQVKHHPHKPEVIVLEPYQPEVIGIDLRNHTVVLPGVEVR